MRNESESGRHEGASKKFWGYASANCSIAMLRQVIVMMPLYFYSPPEGKGHVFLSAAWAGMALLIARILDVVSDPIVGYFSDRTRHRWGKRLPYIVWGLPVWVAATILLFRPPGEGHGVLNLCYLTGVASLFFVGMTVVQIPYLALLPEIAWKEEQAVQVSARMGKFYILGVVLIVVGGWWAAGRYGFLAAMSIFALLAMVPFVFAIRELFRVEQRPVEHVPDGFLASAVSIVSRTPFWTYLVGHSLFVCGYYAILVGCPFFVTEIIGLPKEFSGGFFLVPLIVAMVAAPVVERLCLRYGKKPVIMGAMAVAALLFAWWFFVGKAPWSCGGRSLSEVFGRRAAWMDGVRVGTLVEAVVLFALMGLPVSVQMLVPPAIVSDLVVHDAWRTGQRREALVTGLQGGIEKNAVTLATVLVSMLLATGRAAAHPAGIYRVGLVAAGVTCLGCAVFALYPLRKGWQSGGAERTCQKAGSTVV